MGRQGSAYLEQKDGGVYYIETVLERHALEAGYRVDEAVQNAEKRVCSVDGLVYESCVWLSGDIRK